MTREELMLGMIKIYGHEHPITIEYCRMCERLDDTEWNNKLLTILLSAHLQYPVRDIIDYE